MAMIMAAWRKKAKGKAKAFLAVAFSEIKKESLKISGISPFVFSLACSAIFTSYLKYFSKLKLNYKRKRII